MSHDLNHLATRLEALEAQNRRLKRAAVALGACTLLVGFTAPRLCNTVTAERIVLEDRHGKSRITLDAYSSADPTFTFHDRKGQPSAKIAVDDEGNLDVSVFEAGRPKPANLRLFGSKVGIQGGAAAESAEAPQKKVTEHGID